ncbi:hypothetical protein [Nonomuraea deserti]|nr:hypothetical protein [Nonomuraea deserti]
MLRLRPDDFDPGLPEIDCAALARRRSEATSLMWWRCWRSLIR